MDRFLNFRCICLKCDQAKAMNISVWDINNFSLRVSYREYWWLISSIIMYCSTFLDLLGGVFLSSKWHLMRGNT